MPGLSISAANVFEADGTTLKTYWEAKNTVCDVIEWIDIAASKRSLIQGMNVSLQNPETINLIIHHEADIREGSASYALYTMTLDRDSQQNYGQEYPDEDEEESDGNVFSTIMHDMVAHEFFHYLQEKVGPALGKNVVTEGTARVFEDEVYDALSAYSLLKLNSSEKLFQPMYDGVQISDILAEGLDKSPSPYKSLVFWKLMKSSGCLDVNTLLNHNSSGLLSSLPKVAAHCSVELDVYGDKLASLFAYYNWAMIERNGDIEKIDENEPPTSIFANHASIPEVNIKDWKDKLGISSIGSTLPAYSAKSFRIEHDTITPSCKDDIQMILKGDSGLKLVAVRVDASGTSDIT